MKKRFFVQPAWLDFSMFWAVIVIGITVAVIAQMELVGYGPLNLLAVALLVLTLALAGLQVWRSQLILTPGHVIIRRLLPGNTLALAASHVTGFTLGKHTATLTTRDFGLVTLVHFGAQEPLAAALTAALNPTEGGTSRV